MAYGAIGWIRQSGVYADKRVPSKTRVLLFLLDKANHDLESWWTKEDIAREVRCAVSKVYGAFDHWEALGYLERAEGGRNGKVRLVFPEPGNAIPGSREEIPGSREEDSRNPGTILPPGGETKEKEGDTKVDTQVDIEVDTPPGVSYTGDKGGHMEKLLRETTERRKGGHLESICLFCDEPGKPRKLNRIDIYLCDEHLDRLPRKRAMAYDT